MNPEDSQNNAQVGAPQSRQTVRPLTPPPRAQPSSTQAAAQVIRGQIDAIYGGGSGENTPHTTPVTARPAPTPTSPTPATEPVATPQTSARHSFKTTPAMQDDRTTQPEEQAPSVYQRTMAATPVASTPTKEQWQQYHSAWQQYYQMYYERQYLAQSYASQQQPKSTQAADDGPTTTSSHSQPITARGNNNDASSTVSDSASLSQQEAMKELRDSIRQKVTESAQKVRKSRHFMPAIAGVAVLLIVLVIQFNRPIVGALAAYTSPGNIDPQNIIADPTVEVEVGPEARMIIPKINVDAPVVYGIGPDYNSQMTAMEKGIAHFSIPGANAVPGQVGNAVFAAHSSNDAFARGDYKFVFAQNEKLTEGDLIYMNYESKRYTYSVTRMEIVMPTEVSAVQIDTNVPTLTLISCVPLGTAEKRLLIFAEQISPDPQGATPSEDTSETAPTAEDIPGRPAPTLFERLFGAR